MNAETRPIPGYEGLYEVSNFGKVFSLTRPSREGRVNRKTPLELKQRQPRGDGYLTVSLYGKNGEATTKFVHSLVAETFIGARPEGAECCHCDGNSLNNSLGNLRWGSAKDNQKDRLLHGTDVRGIKHPKAKVSDEQVLEILKRLQSGEKGKHIALELGVSAALISSFKCGNLRKWLRNKNEH